MTWRDYLHPDGTLDHAAIARMLATTRAKGETLDVPLTDELDLPAGDAYRIQDEVAALRYAAGERRVGWKLGYTSAAMREQMGVTEPNFGPLTAPMLLPSGTQVPPGALQPRTEPEIGLLLARGLAGRRSAPGRPHRDRRLHPGRRLTGHGHRQRTLSARASAGPASLLCNE